MSDKLINKTGWSSKYDEIAKNELQSVLSILQSDIDKGIIKNNGIRIYTCLKKLGWESISYCNNIAHSDFYYKCGRNGRYQQSKLVKIFE